MKKKTLSLIIGLALAVSLSACSSDRPATSNDSDAKRIARLEQEIEDLEQELKDLKAENKDLKEQLNGSSAVADNDSQQSGSEAENLLKTTIASPETSGVCGANLTWYYQNGVLAITGTGEMTDYSSAKDTPWYDLRDKIGWVIIDEGATTVGGHAFFNCKTLSKVILPDGIIGIGDEAFDICANIKEITIPDSVTSVGYQPFSPGTIINYKGITYTKEEFNDSRDELGLRQD